MAIKRLGQLRQQSPELTQKYGQLNPEDISSYEGRSVNTGIRPIDYVWGSPEENIEKSALLKKYAAEDPSLGQTIAKYTNQIMGEMTNHRALYSMNRKDLYGLAQDKYLSEMKGVRQAHQKKHNPMVYPSYPGDTRE